jgi:acetate kinase
MRILVLNCGSSSLKFVLFDLPGGQEIASGSIERIGQSDATASFKNASGTNESAIGGVDHGQAVAWVAETVDGEQPAISGIGHRIVHGGETYTGSVVIDGEVENDIDSLSNLAPLHNPAHLTGIRAAQAAFPDVPQVAVFDTAFHQTLPERAYRYPLPAELYQDHRIRRYGFHGTSHSYVSERAAELLDRPSFTGVTCHLGNGSSLAAIQDGRAIDTSMGLTPLGGIPMGTRSGDLDPAIVLHLQTQCGYDAQRVKEILNNESGLLGLSGVSNDLREIETASVGGDERAKLAIDVLTYQIAKSIGGYTSVLQDADGIVFTGGIGENSVSIRRRIVEQLKGIGVEIDDDRNQSVSGGEAVISPSGSGLQVLVIPTREELIIARDTYRLIQDA